MEQLIFGIKLAAIVIGVVVLVILMRKLFKHLDRLLEEKEAARSAGAISPTTTESLSPEVMVAIAAAVTVAFGKKARVKHIRYRGRMTNATWTSQGRMTIMASHMIRRYD